MESGVSGNLVCNVSMFETLYLNPFTLGLLVSYAYLLQLLYCFAPAYRMPTAPSSISYSLHFQVTLPISSPTEHPSQTPSSKATFSMHHLGP